MFCNTVQAKCARSQTLYKFCSYCTNDCMFCIYKWLSSNLLVLTRINYTVITTCYKWRLYYISVHQTCKMTIDDFLTSNINVSTSSLISSSVILISEDSEASNSKSRKAILFLVPVSTQREDIFSGCFTNTDTAGSKRREQAQEVTYQQLTHKGRNKVYHPYILFIYLLQPEIIMAFTCT